MCHAKQVIRRRQSDFEAEWREGSSLEETGEVFVDIGEEYPRASVGMCVAFLRNGIEASVAGGE